MRWDFPFASYATYLQLP